MIGHNCGLCVTHTLHDAYNFIKSLQHRGREATGIAAYSNSRIDVLKWEGEVTRFDMGDLHKIFDSSYHSFLSHVRYATRGRKDMVLDDAHPVTIGGIKEKRGDHVIVRDCDLAIVHNGQVNDKYLSRLEGRTFQTELDTEKLLHLYHAIGEKGIMRNVPGAYTAAIADKNKKNIIVIRDKHGMKPGVLGWKDGKHVVASEEIAFIENGATFIEEIWPGHIYYLFPEGSYTCEAVELNRKIQLCFFEGNYISHVLSGLDGVQIRNLRERLGIELAKEFCPPNTDFVTFLPRCPEVASRSYAKALGLEFKPIFYKTKRERSFLGSTLEERQKSISNNLWLLPGIEKELEGKTIVCMDDSIVRGNNSVWARHLLYDIGKVKQSTLVSYTPPIGIIPEDKIPRGCEFGVDMSPVDQFVARNRSVKEIGEKIGMPVHYLSLEGMLNAFEELGISRKKLCTFCIGGKHPFEQV